MKTLKKISIYFFAILALLLSAAWLLGKYYDKEVKSFIINQLNTRLTAPVKVGDVSLTLIENFPQASLRFSNITISDKLSKNNSDTLLYAEKLYLSFNFWDIWNKRYRINELKVNDGTLFIRYNEAGESNLDLWKKSEQKAQSNFEIDLEKISIQNLFFRYHEPINKQVLNSFIKTAELNGKFSADKFTMHANINGRAYLYSINDIVYCKDKNISIESELYIDSKQVKFLKSSLAVNQLKFLVAGKVQLSKQKTIDLSISGDKLNVKDLLASIPEFTAQKLDNYEAEGNISLTTLLKGEIGNGKLPELSVNFNLQNANIKELESNISLSQFVFSGKYKTGFSGTNDSLWLSTCRGNFNTGNFVITGTVFNFARPEVNGKISTNLDLALVYSFFKWSQAEELKGSLLVNLALKGTLGDSLTLDANRINAITSVGELRITNGRFKLKGNSHALDNVNGQLVLQNNEATVSNFSFTTGKSDFNINGRLKNIIPYLLQENQNLSLSANLKSNQLYLEDFISEKSEMNDTGFRLLLPPFLTCDLTTEVKKLNYQLFEAKSVRSRLALSPKGMLLKNISLSAFNGEVSGELALIPVRDGFILECASTLSQVDLAKVFYQFKNFDQTFITDKNIRGKADVGVLLNSKLLPDLSFVPKEIYSTVSVKINDGELVNVKALKDMTGYLKSNLAIKTLLNVDRLASKLQRIQFETLENTILIKNETIEIPEMRIASTAMNLNIFGSHQFNNTINYNFNFRLSDLYKQEKVTEDGYEVEEQEGTQLFITMSGTTDNPKFKYNKEAAAQARKEKFNTEKATVKSLLKEGFGLFKGDSTIKALPTQNKPGIRFELEDEKNSASEKDKKPDSKKKPEKKPVKKETDAKEYNLDDDF